MNADYAWRLEIDKVFVRGGEVAPRGKKTLEVKASTAIIDMTAPVITIPERRMGYRFMCAEAAWVLSGDDRVATIAPYSKTVGNFSDDGVKFFGAYGPKLRGQLNHVVDSLRRDPLSRQAVENIWRENPPQVKDYPCTLDMAFMIRDGKLDTFVTMRSNDLWLGFVYDVFTASMWSAYVLLHLGMPHVGLGKLHHIAYSRHLYEENIEGARTCLMSKPGFTYAPLNPYEFGRPDDLIEHLWALADRKPVKHRWLEELPSHDGQRRLSESLRR